MMASAADASTSSSGEIYNNTRYQHSNNGEGRVIVGTTSNELNNSSGFRYKKKIKNLHFCIPY